MTGITDPEMNIIDFSEIRAFPFPKSYITIGNFDGVHRGHQAILKEMLRLAGSDDMPVIVVTFFPNPTDFFNQRGQGFYLTTPREKEDLIRAMGVAEVMTLRFDRRFADLSPKAFLSSLKEKLGLQTLVIGLDFTLGKARQGTIPVIKSIGEELSFSVEVISPIRLGQDEISSTAIRQHLDAGKVHAAAELLGRLYAVSGKVAHGSDRGSKIGLPTANLSQWPQKKLPGVGVYATYVAVGGGTYQGITNIGYRPTFEDQRLPNVETHILGFDGNIYGTEITLAFLKKIRDEQKFNGVETFLEQIEKDKAAAQRIFKHDQT